MNHQIQVNKTSTKQKQPLTINISMPNPTQNHKPGNNSYNDNRTQQTDMPESSSTRNQNHTQNSIPRSFLYSDQEINEGLSACNNSFLGKIITDKPIYASSIQNRLESI
jgi:hypothetical protein